MSSAPNPVRGWCLEIDLDDRGRRRTVSLDFTSCDAVEQQIEAQLRRRAAYPFGRLMEFTNESGETLAIVAAAYVEHRISER